jgi:hypothetical protein
VWFFCPGLKTTTSRRAKCARAWRHPQMFESFSLSTVHKNTCRYTQDRHRRAVACKPSDLPRPGERPTDCARPDLLPGLSFGQQEVIYEKHNTVSGSGCRWVDGVWNFVRRLRSGEDGTSGNPTRGKYDAATPASRDGVQADAHGSRALGWQRSEGEDSLRCGNLPDARGGVADLQRPVGLVDLHGYSEARPRTRDICRPGIAGGFSSSNSVCLGQDRRQEELGVPVLAVRIAARFTRRGLLITPCESGSRGRKARCLVC